MRNWLISIIIVMVLACVPAFAQVNIQGPETHGALSPITGANAQAGATANANAGAIAGVINDNDIRNSNTNFNSDFNSNHQSQGQGQSQGQSQLQGQNNDQKIIQVVETPRPFLPAVPQMVTPQINPLIQGGIGSAKDILPNFAGLKWLGEEEVIKVTSRNGWFLDRICMEDLEEDILSKLPSALDKLGVKDASRVAFRVYFKAKSKGIGGGSQGNGAGSYIPGVGATSASALSGGLAGIVGYNSSWIDPTYTIKYYLKK